MTDVHTQATQSQPNITQEQQLYVQSLQTLSVSDLEVERDNHYIQGDVTSMGFVVNELLNRTKILYAQQQVQQQQVSQQSHQQSTNPVQPTTTTSQAVPTFVLSKVKIDRPKGFDGQPSKLSNFVFTVKQYLDTVGVSSPVEKQQFTVTLLSGRALTWWRTWVDRLPHIPTTLAFNDLVIELEKAFRDVDHVDRLRRRLASLKQTHSVSKYIDIFRSIVIELGASKPDDDTVLFQFINGLKRAVQLHVRLQRPSDLISAEYAAEQADSALYLSNSNVFNYNPRSRPQANHPDQSEPMELGAVQQNPKRRVGPCYRCGKLGHLIKDCHVQIRSGQGSGQGQGNGGRPAHNFNRVAEELQDDYPATGACYEMLPPPPKNV